MRDQKQRWENIQGTRTLRRVGHIRALLERHKEVIDREVITARAAHTSRMPDIDNRSGRDWREHHACFWLAVGEQARLPMLVDHAAADQRRGVLAAAGKMPRAADPVPAVDQVSALRRPELPGGDTVCVTEHSLSNRRMRKSIMRTVPARLPDPTAISSAECSSK